MLWTLQPMCYSSSAVATGEFRIIDLADVLLVYIPDERGKFPAGMHLTVREQRKEIECGSASEAGGPPG
jgi:hypothetical protein